ncbi:MAG: cytochrome c [Chitinophagaceae bacterium]|nr:cytochrome c [Chitinophagaceae bacterium]
MKKGIIIFSLLFVVIYLLAQTKPKTASQGGTDKASVDRGKKIYDIYCLACHQADGSGVPRLNPPLIKTKWVLGDKKELITVILKGMDEPIEVDGEDYNNVMASHAFLKDQEVADVLTYVRKSFGNKASGVISSEVKTVRATMK